MNGMASLIASLIIPEDPIVMLLGATPEGLEGRAKIYLLHVLLTAAIKCITINWLKPNPPSYGMWLGKVWDIHHRENHVCTETPTRHLIKDGAQQCLY